MSSLFGRELLRGEEMKSITYDIRGLTKVYRGSGVRANEDITLSIPSGIIFAVLGPNGAGKTTLVRQLMGLLRPTSGSIHLFGEDVIARPHLVPTWVAYYGQHVTAFQAHRFTEVLWITGMLRGQSFREAKQQAGLLMERFDASPLAYKLLVNLSGGERRLASLLSAFMGNRPVLILDEPTNDLDPTRRRHLWDYLHERNAVHGTTVIVVSHNLPEVEIVAHSAVLINEGRVAALGTLGDLKKAVAEEVRLEIRLKQEDSIAVAVLSTLPRSRRVRPGLWVVPAQPNEAADILHRVLQELTSRDVIDDFRLVAPSLDDVFFRFTGREARADAS
jgi:ABC-type multidrug transport system ATPase subunit